MKKSILICGGLPRAATTFLHSKLSNYSNTYMSLIKEPYLFERNDEFIDRKLNALRSGRIHLDFTPEYIFSPLAIEKIQKRNLNCFFILREYGQWRASLTHYLEANKIENKILSNISRIEFDSSVRYVKSNFLTFSFEEVTNKTDYVISQLEINFGFSFGKINRNNEKRNTSNKRTYYISNVIVNRFNIQLKNISSLLFGLI